jgi:CheY-like chemotaxis protein
MPLHTLLLVDDNIETQSRIRSMFADEPIQLIVTENGHRALDHIQANPPDIILANVGARGVDGYALAHYVSQRSHLRSIPVLLLAGAPSSVNELRIDASGAFGFLTEPLHPAVVVPRVKAALGIMPDRDLQLAGAGSQELSGDLNSAFDAIDATMTGRHAHPAGAVTPEVLAQIVGDAVARAIDAYDRARGLPPDPARDAILAGLRGNVPAISAAMPAGLPDEQPVIRKAEVDRLLGEMGINDIEFEAPPTPSPDLPYVVEQRELLADMGVEDFDFDDAPARVETRAFETNPLPEPPPAPIAPPADEPMEDLEDGFSWLADELHTHLPKSAHAREDSGELRRDGGDGWRDPEPVPEAVRAPEPEPQPEPVRVPEPEPAPPRPQAVGPARPGFLARFSSWIQAKPPAPAVPAVVEIAPESEPARAAEPEPPAPEPVSAPIAPPEPRPVIEDPNEIRFTFDPILPVPPRLPREPRKTK